MVLKSDRFAWRCIICEQPVKVLHDGDDNIGLLPNLIGGTINIHFGYGSKHDMIPCQNEQYQCAICDECFDKKISSEKSIIRRVIVQNTTKIKVVDDTVFV